MIEQKSAAAAVLWGVLYALHPWAATGAAFGCCFFLAMPSAYRGGKRALLGVFSWGIGYGSGVWAYGGGPPYSDKAMIVSAATSAVAVSVFLAWRHMIDNGGALPPWMESVLDRVPFLKRKGGTDGN